MLDLGSMSHIHGLVQIGHETHRGPTTDEMRSFVVIMGYDETASFIHMAWW